MSSLPYENLLDFIVKKVTPQEILAYKASEQEQERAQALLYKNNAGTLTPQERLELEQMLEVERLMMVLKAKAMVALDSQS